MNPVPFDVIKAARRLTDLGLAAEKLPSHIAIIMDGNGRWAKARGFPRIEGHRRGVRSVRETIEECAELGKIIAAKLNQCTGPATLFMPLKGVSMIDAEGQPFHSPEADQALFRAVRDNLDTDKVELIEMNMNINDLDFAVAVANRLLRMLSS